MNHPKDLEWFEGDLPDVHTVPYDCCILAWFVNDFPGGPDSKEWKDIVKWHQQCGQDKWKWEDVHNHLRRIEMVHPWKDDLNPLRWCDSSCHPIGCQERVIHWAWLRHPFLVGKLLDERNN